MYHPDHATLHPTQPHLIRNSKFPRFTTVQQNWSNTAINPRLMIETKFRDNSLIMIRLLKLFKLFGYLSSVKALHPFPIFATGSKIPEVNPFQSSVPFHVETSLVICCQITGFYTNCNAGLEWVNNKHFITLLET